MLIFIVAFITWIGVDFCKQTKKEYYATFVVPTFIAALKTFTDLCHPKLPIISMPQ